MLSTACKLRFVVILLAMLASTAFAAERPPNVIFILVDDLGWTDVGCFGSKFYETPNLDRLAREGMKFTSAYSACTVCSPSRASLLTGKYPARLHITDWIPGHGKANAKLNGPDWLMHLPLEEPNLARALHGCGYATVSIGKWHLGAKEFFPDKQGFDLNIGGYDKGQPPTYFAPFHIPTLAEGSTGEFLTDREASEAVKFIEQNKEKPFFVYLTHYAVHQPIAGKKEVVEKYKQKARRESPQHDATYAALIESVDDSLGRIMKTLDDLKLTDRTIIIFTSDNGGLLPTTSNAPLRAGKGSAYEGGVRVPMIVRWPGIVTPGSVCEVPVISPDFYPTLLEVAGGRDDPQHVVDGESIVPLLRQSGPLKREAIYWHYPHYHPGGASPYGAIRQGDFKLIEFFEDNHVELYDLKTDIAEKTDLTVSMSDKTTELREKLHAWEGMVGAQMPTPNPKYDPAKETAHPAANKSKKPNP